MSRVPFASFDFGLFSLHGPSPPMPRSCPDTLLQCQGGTSGQPVTPQPSVACYTCGWTHRWEREIPGGGMQSSAGDSLWGAALETADKTFSPHFDRHARKARGIFGWFSHLRFEVSDISYLQKRQYEGFSSPRKNNNPIIVPLGPILLCMKLLINN